MRRLEGYNVELTQTLEFGQQKSRRAADEKVRFPPLQMRSPADDIARDIMTYTPNQNDPVD